MSRLTRAPAVRLAATTIALGWLALAPACGSSPTPPVCSGACTCGPPSQGSGAPILSSVSSVCACGSGQSCVLGLLDGGAAAGTELDCSQSNACEINAGNASAASCGSLSVCNGTCGNGCKVSCSNQATCGVDGGPMVLGSAASVTCSDSNCTVQAGNNSAISCEAGAVCTLTVGANSAINCQGGSTCDITCQTGGCTVSCGDTSTCHCIGACAL